MSDIFITYAREDIGKAQILAGLLESVGWSVWWDRRIPPGKSFDQVIEDALDSARCVVVLWSKASVASDWVRAEAAEGKARNILVPVLLEETRIPLEFRRIQAARLLTWTGNFPEPDFVRFRSSLALILGEPAPPSDERQLKADSAQQINQPAAKRITSKAYTFLRKPRLLVVFAIILGITFIIIMLKIRTREVTTLTSEQPSSSTILKDTNQSPVDLISSNPIDLFQLAQYKIDIYFDQACDVDRKAAMQMEAFLRQEIPNAKVILAPRPLDFVVSVVKPTSYEVRYDEPFSERDAALALVNFLNQKDNNWQVSAIPSWSKTEGVLSLFLFTRAFKQQ